MLLAYHFLPHKVASDVFTRLIRMTSKNIDDFVFML